MKIIITFNKRLQPFIDNTFHRINLVKNKFEKKAAMTNSQQNDKNIMQAWSQLLLIPGTMTRNVT
jgi:hypothetical protein